MTWRPVTCAGSGKSALAAGLAGATSKPSTLLTVPPCSMLGPTAVLDARAGSGKSALAA